MLKKFFQENFHYHHFLRIYIYISWSDLHMIYNTDRNLEANLRKAPKLTYKALHSIDKQDVELAIAIFHDKTIVRCQKYLPNRSEYGKFSQTNFILVDNGKFEKAMDAELSQ